MITYQAKDKTIKSSFQSQIKIRMIGAEANACQSASNVYRTQALQSKDVTNVI